MLDVAAPIIQPSVTTDEIDRVVHAAVTGRRTSLMEEEGNQGGAESEPNELLSIEHNSYREPKDNCMDCWVGAADQGKVSVTVVALPKSKLQ